MRLMWQYLFGIAALFGFVKNQRNFFLPSNHTGEEIFANILSEVLQTSRTKDIIILLQNSSLDKQANDILSQISATTTRRVPTLQVNADRKEQEFQISSCTMSRDLIMYIYISEQEPDIIKGALIAADIRYFVYNQVRPKVLILMILRQSSRHITTLFRAMWSRKILDTIVVEYSRSKYSAEYSTIIHRYNPFNDSHTIEPYSAQITWFTDNFPNMQGYPFVYAFMHHPPYSDIASTFTEKKVRGVDKIQSETLADKMNFTGVIKILPNDIPIIRYTNNTASGLIPDIATGKYDALLTTMPMIKNVHTISPLQQYGYPLLIENWCIVVPKLPKQNFNGNAVIKLFLINFSIVGIFWICSRLMKFNPNRWHPLKIIGMMLATSLPPAPRTFRERLIFLSILAVYACYSSTLFIELTSTNLEGNRYVQFNSLQDVIDSDLLLMVHYVILNVTRENNNDFEQHFQKSDKKIVSISQSSFCLEYISIYRNASCLTYDIFAKLAAVRHMQNGETTIMITDICYLSPPVSYMFPEESPYVKRINDIVLMLAEGGISDKWSRDYLRNETRESRFQINRHKTDFMYISIFYSIIYILITGYSISVLVFISELIWKYVNINLNLC
ncbi:uncharacterized protein [Linepithema humile]|uniref:uncharacterized protein n=1 Tax=Linepithema humile TaxID=83485 RepID=UPI00351EB2BE